LELHLYISGDDMGNDQYGLIEFDLFNGVLGDINLMSDALTNVGVTKVGGFDLTEDGLFIWLNQCLDQVGGAFD
jgi:hypothetical protein